MENNVIFSDITERDTDLAIIRSFLDYENVRDLFFSQIKRHGEVVKVFHSLMQQESDGHSGESDIVIICKDCNKKFAIFIEDKIAADPQPSQRKRYDDRAMLLANSEGFEKAYIFLCAPEAYIGTAKADGYNLFVSHEQICELLNENDLSKANFNFSCDEKKQGYTPVKNDAVTEFWLNLYRYIGEYYPKLKINKTDSPRGTNATWPGFKTSVKNLRIVWKSDIKWNCVDLEFGGMAKNKEEFNRIVNMIGATNYEPVETTGSMSLRVQFPDSEQVSFSRPFADQLDNINKFLSVISEFDKLADKIHYLGITNIKEK